ncbi:MAG: hypothetical protein QXU40_00990 [Candidatus Pacearchaeota archaeon]
MATVEVSGVSYHINDKLIKKWENLKDGKLRKIDEDRAYVVDGRERCGKSLFTIQQSAFIDPEIIEDQERGKILKRIPIPPEVKSWEEDSEWRREAIRRYKNGTLLPQITFNSMETIKAIRFYKSSDKKTKVIIFDEAFRGMSNKRSLSKENKYVTQALMEMGQSNLIFWIVSPSFFLLELYPAVLRTNALFHVVKDKKTKKRVVRIFNYRKKAMLYQIGLRRGWGYSIATTERVNFYNVYPGGRDFEWRYRLKKQLSFMESDFIKEKDDSKFRIQRDLIIRSLYEELKSAEEVSKRLKKAGVSMSAAQVRYIVKRKGAFYEGLTPELEEYEAREDGDYMDLMGEIEEST